MATTVIRVVYSSIDGAKEIQRFGTIAGASQFARKWDALQGGTQAEGLGIGDRQASDPPKRADRAGPAARHHYARHAPARLRVQTGLALNCTRDRRPKTSSRTGATPEGGSG